MKNHWKVIFSLFLMVGISGIVFSNGQSDASQVDDGKVEITYWHFPQVFNVPGFESVSEEYGEWEKYLAEEFMKENPDVNVVTELVPWEGGTDKINVAIVGGNPPDLVFDYLGRSGGWYTQGAAVAVDDLVSKELQNNLLDSFKSTYTIDGKLHALPGFSWNMNLILNNGLLSKIGVKGDVLNGSGNPYSHKEFEDLLVQIKDRMDPGSYPLGLACGSKAGDYIWWQFLWGFGAHLYEEDGSVVKDSPEMVEAYKWLVSLRDKGLMAPGVATMTNSDTMQLWSSGLVALHGGNAHYRNLIANGIDDGILDMELNVEPMLFPSKSGDSGFNAMGPTGFIILSKDMKKQQATGRFIDFVMQDKYWKSHVSGAGQFPATKSVAAMNIYSEDSFQSTVSNMISEYPAGDFGLSNIDYDKIRTALASCGQAIFANISTPEEAVSEFLDEVRKLNQN